MSQRRVCRLHGLVISQCRCRCPNTSIYVDCPPYCPQHGQPPVNEPVSTNNQEEETS